MDEKIVFETEEGQEEFFILEQTRVSGVNYILVADSEGDDAMCYILKDMSKSEDLECIYEIVEDDEELKAVSKVFEELLEDVDIEM